MGIHNNCFEILIDPSLIITALSIRENFRFQLWNSTWVLENNFGHLAKFQFAF